MPARGHQYAWSSQVNELFDAAQRGDAAAVDRVLQDRPGLLNAPDPTGQTALQVAIVRKHVPVVESLLKHGADFRIKDNLGRTAITLAARSGSEELATRFLLNIPEIDLPEAVAQGDADTVRLVLLGNRSEVFGNPYRATRQRLGRRGQCGDRASPLRDPEASAGRPAQVGGYEIAEQHGGIAAVQAAWNGQADLLADYIKAGNDVNVVDETWWGTPLHQAADAGNLKLVRMLLDAGAKVNRASEGWTALHAAASGRPPGGRRSAVGRRGENRRGPALGLAAHTQCPVGKPSRHGPTLEHGERRSTPAWPPDWAAPTEAKRLIAELPSNPPVKASVSQGTGLRRAAAGLLGRALRTTRYAQGPLEGRLPGPPRIGPRSFIALEGCTLLHVAAEAGQTGVMRWLIEHGAPINASGASATRHARLSVHDMTPLHLAAAAGQIEAVKVLLAAGANVEGTTEKNSLPRGDTAASYTPLVVAATEGKKEMVAFLLDRGADIEAASAPQVTALSAAAGHGHKELCELLLARGAKLNGRPGASPLVAAAGFRGQLEIVEYLLAARGRRECRGKRRR